MHCQVTHALRQVHDVLSLVPPMLEALFSFPTDPSLLVSLIRTTKHKCLSSNGQVSIKDRCPQDININIHRLFFQTSLNAPNPQPEGPAVGSVTAVSPLTKKNLLS